MQLRQETGSPNSLHDTVGSRVRGAFEATQGIGRRDGRENEEIARQGRRRTAQGIENMGQGGRMVVNNEYPTFSDGGSNYRQQHHRENDDVSGIPGSGSRPSHHRDDAISGLPQGEIQELQETATSSGTCQHAKPFIRQTYN
ncbi:hypothetical protein FA15DRAFT_704683 [Coprinopsis marcescibilis]|uniref:Uncharacterized protein n=1 Tax=Coprinopsis marcescibilis TaxID=230819 RepID=A0A5C3KVV4_COPMA|nr:hypothetical protein FA15DRAFT_704683 [Coprinopsis marcescibilis]